VTSVTRSFGGGLIVSRHREETGSRTGENLGRVKVLTGVTDTNQRERMPVNLAFAATALAG